MTASHLYCAMLRYVCAVRCVRYRVVYCYPNVLVPEVYVWLPSHSIVSSVHLVQQHQALAYPVYRSLSAYTGLYFLVMQPCGWHTSLTTDLVTCAGPHSATGLMPVWCTLKCVVIEQSLCVGHIAHRKLRQAGEVVRELLPVTSTHALRTRGSLATFTANNLIEQNSMQQASDDRSRRSNEGRSSLVAGVQR
jgi:hypothetical protein